MARPQLKLAIVGGANAFHAKQFAGIFNSATWSEHASTQGFAPMAADARVAKVWDPVAADAQSLADSFQIGSVCDSLEDALTDVDGVILADDCVPSQHRLVPVVASSGVAFFLDKPMAPTFGEAQEVLASIARHQALGFTSSALRFCRELREVMPSLIEEGGVRCAVVTAPSSRLVFYAIHALELATAAMGRGIIHAKGIHHAAGHAISCDWSDGRQAYIAADDRVRDFTAILYTAKRGHSFRVSDSKYYYYHLMREFVEMLVTRQAPVAWDDSLEIIRWLDDVSQVQQQIQPEMDGVQPRER